MEFSDLSWMEEDESLGPLFDLDAFCAAYGSEATAPSGYPTDLLDTAHTGLPTLGDGCLRAVGSPEAPPPALVGVPGALCIEPAATPAARRAAARTARRDAAPSAAACSPVLSGRIAKKQPAHAPARVKGVTTRMVQGRGRNKTRTVHWTGSAAEWTDEELEQLARAVAENTFAPNKRGNGISWAAIKRRAPTDYPLLVKRSAEKALAKKWAKM